MNKAILVALVATVIAIGGIVAYFSLHEEEKEVDYSMYAVCDEPGIAVVTITLIDDEGITEGYLTNGYQKDPVTFVNRVGRVTYESPSYHVGIIPIPKENLWLEVPGFTCHRVHI